MKPEHLPGRQPLVFPIVRLMYPNIPGFIIINTVTICIRISYGIISTGEISDLVNVKLNIKVSVNCVKLRREV